MITIANRRYADTADLHAMINLIRKRPARRVFDFPSIDDLYEMMHTSHGRAHTRLWEDGRRQIVGFAIVEPRFNTMWYESMGGQAGATIESEIIAWGEEEIQQGQEDKSKAVILHTSCRDDYYERIRVLKKYGFIAQPVRTLHMSRSLREPILEPQLPSGFIIRHVTGEHEAERLTALHQVAFGTQNLTVEDRLSWMRTPEYDPELDLVAIASDGAMAAYCLGRINQEENALTGLNIGYTDPIGTRPDYQRQGLARALLLTGLRLLRDRGMGSAALSTWGENTAMQKTAESVGFQVTATTIFFQKEIVA